MPTGKIANEFFERLARVETRVEGLILYQKVQIGALTAIFAAVIGAWMRR